MESLEYVRFQPDKATGSLGIAALEHGGWRPNARLRGADVTTLHRHVYLPCVRFEPSGELSFPATSVRTKRPTAMTR